MQIAQDWTRHNVFGMILDLWRKWRRHRAQVMELDCCGAVELDRIALDLGLSSSELHKIAAGDEEAASLLYRRLQSLRLDPKVIDPALMRDLQRCCANCKNKALCEHELEDEPKVAKWPSYCSNEQTIFALTGSKEPQ